MSTVATPPLQEQILDWQRTTSERLPSIVPRELVEDGSAGPSEKERRAWVEERQRLVEKIIDCVLDIANGMPEGVEDPGVARMLARSVDLQRAAQADPEGSDAQWLVRKAARDLKDTVSLMERRLDRLRLDDPSQAATFVIGALQNVESQRIAQLLGVSARTISQWRGEKVSTIKKSPERVVLVGQLVRYLQSTWTPHGIVAWFETPRSRLGNRSPLQLIDSEDLGAWERLRELARGSRSQLAD